VASACAPKSPLLPLCATEAEPDGGPNTGGNLPDGGTSTDGGCNVGVPLEPAPSALYIVIDDSHRMHAAFGAGGFATVVGLSLDNPVFRRLFIAFKRFAHDGGDCTVSSMTTTLTMPDEKFALARVNQQPIATLIGMGAMAADQPYYLQGAMRSKGAYAEVTGATELSGLTLNKKAVMFFVNAAPDATTDCTPPLDGTVTNTLSTEAAAGSVEGVDTYFVLLANDSADATATAKTTFGQVTGANLVDATGDTMSALAAFEPAVESLATCLYEKPSNVVDSSASIAFVPPGQAPVSVPFNGGCMAGSMVDGWNIEGSRIRICGASCDNLRGAIALVTGQAFTKNQPAPDVPVTATILCQ
jgi:hypothetical protein